MAKITVQNTQITVVSIDERDYISLTDMVRNIENGLALIEKWLRNKNTIEFLGIWESMYNPNFNSPEFEGIKNAAGLNRFILSVKQWVEKTNSRGIIAKAGRYGGTYAHKDIAFEFATWVSPQFKLFFSPETFALVVRLQGGVVNAVEYEDKKTFKLNNNTKHVKWLAKDRIAIEEKIDYRTDWKILERVTDGQNMLNRIASQIVSGNTKY